MANLRDILAGFREDIYPSVRNAVARTALDLGGASTGEDAKRILHEGGNYALTKKLGETELVPPWLAANMADLGYLGNEAFTGTLAALTGRPFYSDYGFRWKDVALNRAGQDRAVNELEAKAALRDAIRQEQSRGWRGVRAAGGRAR